MLDRRAAENDREAADADRGSTEQELLLAEQRLLQPAAPHRARVLLIDDDVALTRSLGRHLDGRCDVTTAVNGQEGLERLLAPGAYDLVLCDLSMPVMNGRQLYEQLLKRAPQLAPSVVFITGGALSHDTEQFLEAIPNTKLLKPFSPRALLDLLDARVGPERSTGTSAGASPQK